MEKYDIPDEAKTWVFESICIAWRKYKNQLKRKHIEAYENDELRMENMPVDFPESHFKEFLNCWNSDPHKAEMERLQSTQETEDDNHSVDAFASVMGPEHPGCVRLYRQGVTKTVLKGKIGNLGSSSDVADERMQQRMLEKLNEQKYAMEQHITMNVVAQLQRLNPELRLDADMLRFVEASSAQQVVVQLIHRPSVGSNNEGGVNQEIEEDNESGVNQKIEEDDESEELDLT